MLKGDRLPRLLKLIHTIETCPGLSAVQLARECGVGERQIYRDLKELDYAGVPVYHDNGYRLVANFSLQQVSFSLDEALALLYGLKLAERQKGLFPTLRLKERLLALLPSNLRDGMLNLEPRLDIAEAPAADYSGKSELFRILSRAFQESRQVEIEYYTFGRDEENQRQIDPYHLFFKDGFWYLAAFCHLRQQQRMFRIDRIRHIKLLAAKFTPPATGFNGSNIDSAWGVEMGEEFDFKIRFWGDSARFVRETRFHPQQRLTEEAGGTLCFQALATGLRPIARWVLTFGGEAEVLEPPELRRMVAEALRAGAEKYQNQVDELSFHDRP